MAPIEIDWMEVFCDRGADDGAGVCFTSPSPTPPRARAGPPVTGKQKRPDTPGMRRYESRLGALRRYSGAAECGRRRLLLDPISWADDEAPKAADDTGYDDRAAALKAYDFGPEDAVGERVSHRYSAKKSRVSSGKENYRKLEMTSGGMKKTVKPISVDVMYSSKPCSSGKENYGQLEMSSGGMKKTVGERKPISVDVMYSSKPCSTSFSAHQQRVHAIGLGPEDVDYEKVRGSGNHSFSNSFKGGKEQHQDSSSRNTQKVEDVVLLDDEEQLDEKVGCRTPDEEIESKIYYPSRDDPEAVELSGSDITCLEPGVYLSSPVINYYIQYIKRTKLPTEDKFYIFNSYFYNKLEKALVKPSDFLKLRRWWKGVNIFHRAYIILPIHGMSHWSLIIICNPGKESDSGPIIIHLDSLGMHSSINIFGTVKRYLEAEWRYLKNNRPPDTFISESVWDDIPSKIRTHIVEVPQQKNAYDCGIFMLYYMERFVREAPERFTRDNLGMFSRSWFNSEDASELRPRIQALLHEEFESVRLDDAMSDTDSYDGSDKEDTVAPSDSSEMVRECVESGDSGKNDGGFKVAAAEEGSGESGGKSNVGIAEVPALDELPTLSTRHDENVDCILLEAAATFSDSIKDEDPEKSYSDSSEAEEEKVLAILSPHRCPDIVCDSTVSPHSCPDIVCDSCDSDSDGVMIVEVRNRRATRRNCSTL